MRHTPGPWTYFPKRKYGEHHVSVPIKDSGMRLALFPDGIDTENPVADARLIAAAPELLAACRELVERHDANLPDGVQFTDLVAAARAAIAKATGGQP